MLRKLIKKKLLAGLVTAGVVITGLGVPATPGGAAPRDPEVAPAEGDPSVWTAPPDEVFEAVEIAARAADEGVTPAEAEARFRLENAAVHIQEEARLRWPDTFAGVWMDRTGGTFDVMVGFTADAAANVTALASADGVPAGRVHGADQPVSLTDLEAVTNRVGADQQLLQAGKANQVSLPAAVEATGGRFGFGIDVEASAIHVDVDSLSPQFASAFRSAYGVAATFSEGSGGPGACSISYCKPRIDGGIRFDGNGWCSTGFNTYGGSGSRFILSAGHCTLGSPNIGSSRSHAGTYYGYTHRALYAGRTDAERIIESSPGVWDHTNLIRLDGTVERTITSSVAYSGYVQNTYIGRSGATTDTDRGYITQIGYTPGWVPSAQAQFVRADFCVQGGDSGGPVWRNNTAYGVVSGGLVADPCSTSSWGVFTAMQYALGDLSLLLATSDFNDPPIARATHSCGSLYSCTFDGTGSSDVDGSIANYTWNFGDGTSGSGATAAHAYPVGTTSATVTLTVGDNGGRTATTTFTAQPKLL